MAVEGLFLWKETRRRVGRKCLQLGVSGEEDSNRAIVRKEWTSPVWGH